MYFSNFGTELQKTAMLLLGAEAHHVFDPGPVVPAAVEDDHLAGGWKVRHIALNIHLRFFAVRRGRQGHGTEDPGADLFRHGADGAALAGGIAALKDHYDPQALVLHPLLELAQLGLELAQFLHIFLAAQFFRLVGFFTFFFSSSMSPYFLALILTHKPGVYLPFSLGQ